MLHHFTVKVGDVTTATQVVWVIVERQLVEQPHYLYVTLALTSKFTRGTYLIEVTINIEFEEVARIIFRSTCLCRSTADESQFIHFEIIDKSIEQANRGVSLYILVNAIREKNPLSSILTFFICHIFFVYYYKYI